MLDLISRIITLFILFGLVGGALIFPFFPILLLTQPSLESFWVVLFVLGLYPMLLSYLHGAIFIEHFITRKISNTFVDENNMLLDPHFAKLSYRAGAYLSKALLEFGPALDDETRHRGQTLLERHQAITRFIWPGMGFSAVAAIGMVLLKELGLPWAPV